MYQLFKKLVNPHPYFDGAFAQRFM